MRKYLSKDYRRAHGTIITLVFFTILAVIHPANLLVNLTKLTLAACAGVIGYWLDRLLTPYASPYDLQKAAEKYDYDSETKAAYLRSADAAGLRRAIIVGCAIIGVCLGL